MSPLETVRAFMTAMEKVDFDTALRYVAEHGWFSLPVTGVIQVRDGKIKYWREYFDMAVIQNDLMKLMGTA